ncbi:MAG TPA: 1-acyl-sn-glycerol-3-phosphate acyltransferase [Bacteroidia bacterium]|jgi:1-acyl-sn-glycerol-3-phosphate acyltransferase|nr:1-acyl-sn-glycerol-3-phosphate acyltransferase [Bacteroidia bacterium]
MNSLAYFAYLFFSKRKLIFTILVIGLCGVLGFYASKIKLEEDITRFVPQDKNSASINSILDNLKSKDKLVIHFTANSGDIADKLVEKGDSVFSALQTLPKESYSDITHKISDNTMQSVYDIFYNNLPFFLSEKDYLHITNLIKPDSIQYTLKKDYEALLSPSGVVIGKFIKRDPLNIVPLALKKMESIKLDENFETYNGAIVTKDHKHLLMFITPAFSATETAKNKKLIDFVKTTSHKLSNNEIKIEPFGACMVSLGNAEQLRKDTFLTTTITIICIALLIGFYFKNILPIVFIFLPVVFGMVFSLAMLFLFKGVVSAIAVAAGAAVLGIAINYSLHFFTHYKHKRDVKETLSDLTTPMLIGCTTTVGAFFGLVFTKSEALHDFGEFAAFSLIGALLFSVFVLPHLLKFSFRKQPIETEHKETFLDKLVNYRLDKNKIVLLSSLAITIALCFFASNVGFESDMNKMSFMDEETRLAEKHLDEVNHFAARSVYIFATGNTMEEALQANEMVYEKLLSCGNRIKKISSISTIFPSEKLQKEKLLKWNNFFSQNVKESLKNDLIKYGAGLKFKPEAFASFTGLLNKNYSVINKADGDTLNKLVLKDWTATVNGKQSIVTHVKIDPGQSDDLFKIFSNNENVVVFSKYHLTSQFVEAITSDFSTILWITSILVFGFMLLSHGRIEMAIINFLPMFISWLWILGFMGIFGIKFNVINIIISTFIFGLGDDYSIFIMDGLTNEYKYGKKNLGSFKTSILLSALTTIIGIGVMVFAKHPALKSIAVIAILGMFCVVFVSFIVQPLLFNWMVLNRKNRGLQPYTLKYLLITGFSFTIFTIISLILTLIGFLIITAYPATKKKRKLAFHYLIAATFKFALACFVNVRKRIVNNENEKFSKPALIVANHQSHIDLAMTLQLSPKIIVFTNDWVYNSPFFGWIVKMADYYPVSAGYENSLPKLEALVKDGYSILIYPEGTRSITGDIGRFHKGAFLLAEKLNLDIVPVLIHGAGDAVTKKDFYIKDGSLTVKYLPRIPSNDIRFGTTYQEKTKGICNYMRTEYELLRDEFEPVKYYRSRLINNYIYKGPLLEWYCRVKTAMEGNYKLFESLMPKKGKVVDVGCGYGFLPYMLLYKGRNREILGLDYDEEKICVAQNCAGKRPNINFETADVTTYEFPYADGFIISDVLHYLKPEEQVNVIEKLAQKINKNGVLVIRDADADKKARQAGTAYTEFVSTTVSGFNKTKESGLHFVSGKLIKDTLAKFPNLVVETLDTTKLTSNIIYVVRNP